MAWIEYEVHDAVAVITFNRPERRNALGREMLIQFAEAFVNVRDDDNIAVAVLTGTGNTFCSGADLKERAEAPGGFRLGEVPEIPVANPFFRNPAGGNRRDRDSVPFHKPVIAAVNGYAVGGGFLISQRADLCIAVPSASFEITEIWHGGAFGWDWGYLANLSRRAQMELALGARVGAQRAYDMGLVNEVVAEDELAERAMALATRIAQLPPLARRFNLELVRALAPTVPAFVAQRGLEYYNESRNSKDAREAFKSQTEHRRATFSGS